MGAIAKLGAEASQARVLVETGGLLPSAAGARIRLSGGRLTVTDGPFTEAKEVHWPRWEGEIEIREIMDPSSLSPEIGQR
jgi:hypothetical protein